MIVRGEGPKPAEIAAIGEGPGRWEERTGRPFQGKAGDLMNFHLFKAGVNRELIWVDNIVPFRCTNEDGDDRPPTEAEIKQHSQRLRKTLNEVQPKLILAIGRTATRFFLGDVDMEAVHGIPFDMGRWVVIPCYHTAAALHDASGDMAAYVAHDFQQVGLYLKGQIKVRKLLDEYPEPKYKRLRGGAAVEAIFPEKLPWRAPIYVDTEGYPGFPYSLQFSFGPGHGYMIHADDKEGLERFVACALGCTWVIHNALYDLRILLDLGIDLIALGIPFEDSMLVAYLTRLDPQGLKPLAIRYAGMRMQSYDDLTQPYEKKQLMDWLYAALEYEDDIPNPEPILERDSKTGEFKVRQPQHVSKRIRSILTDVESGKKDKDGEPISVLKRWAKVEPELKAGLTLIAGPQPRFHLGLVPIRDVIHYGCRDTDATARVKPPLWAKMEALDLREIYEIKRAILPMVERMMRIGIGIDPRHFHGMRADIERTQDRLDREIKKHNGKWLNVDSNPQVADLLYRRLGLNNERLTKKGRVPSTDDKALESLAGAHPVVNLIIDRREANTIDGFARDLPVFGDEDNRIHCTLRVTRVAQGRLAASNPNLLGIPVRSDLGRRLRGGFVTQCGRHLGSADLSQIEMLVLADKSQDPILLKEMRAGIDIHAQNAVDLLRAPPAKAKDPQYREPAKRAGFGVVTGITDQGLYEQLRLSHIETTRGQCRDILAAYMRKYRGVEKYINDIRAKTRRLGYVRDSWGMLRYLPGVWSDIPYVRGEAERQSHSHDISGTAQGIIQRAMGRLWQRLLDEVWPAGIYCEILLQIHDELIWEGEGEPDSWQAQMIAEIIREELVRDSPMFAVPLKAKATTGKTWGELK